MEELNDTIHTSWKSKPMIKHKIDLIFSNFGCFAKVWKIFSSSNHWGFSIISTWWFQPTWKIWVKMGSSSPSFGVNIKNISNKPPRVHSCALCFFKGCFHESPSIFLQQQPFLHEARPVMSCDPWNVLRTFLKKDSQKVHSRKLTWSTIWRCISYWKWDFSKVMLVFRGVTAPGFLMMFFFMTLRILFGVSWTEGRTVFQWEGSRLLG